MNRLPILFALLFAKMAASQVSVLSYSVNSFGQPQLEIEAKPNHYYVVQVRNQPTDDFHAMAIFTEKNGPTILSESLAALPLANYKITEHPVAAPADTDGDGFDDLLELADLPAKSPFNSAIPIDTADGVAFLRDRTAFETLSFKDAPGFQIPELQGLEVVKFFLLGKDADYPQLYFINKKHSTHTDFANAISATGNPTLMTGLVVFYPNLVAPNGSLGTYRFNFQPQNLHAFKYVQKVAEMLAANLPFLKNNLCYYPYPQTSLPLYFQEKAEFDASRVCVLFDDDIYGNVNYLALHLAEGFGLLRHMTDLQETPGSRDVVIYESLPNSLPRVGGIITTVTQTPLSHVNLRAIQDNLPNAFIRNALQKPEISSLLGKYVHFTAAADTFTIREASLQEVEHFYETRRPAEPLIPIRDLSKTKIEPLDSIQFEESASFGVKCANVATMRTFGFPAGTIPDGFGIPFYFYDEFMKFNGFYVQLADMLKQPAFQSDFAVQQQMLADFREKIKTAAMPQWMMDALGQMQLSFPAGSSIRCRSSTNNEDLPGFSGAGLYDSRTQHPGEGHISKSIKQVYASMWNYRAFDEREFYRVDHFKAAMGVLVHLHFDGEQANGVGVSIDPVYQSNGTFYLNTQVGENLITNPNALSIPEEMLLNAGGSGFAVMQPSNQVAADSLIFREMFHGQMRQFLATIHERFKELYGANNAADFAMEIEFKITENGQLAIKQARPWASFWAGFEPPPMPPDSNSMQIFPNPFRDFLSIKWKKDSDLDIRLFNSLGQLVLSETVRMGTEPIEIDTRHLAGGAYVLRFFDKMNGGAVVRVLMK